MKFYSVYDEEFKEYGRVLEGYNTEDILTALSEKTPLPEGTAYVPEEPEIQNLPSTAAIADSLFGGVPAQFGWCNGHNTKLNCLEYHRCSEFNLGVEDFVLLLAKQTEIDKDNKLDTACVKAFRVPKGVLVEVFATTLHYAPCHVDPEKGFKVLVVLSKGTNTDASALKTGVAEDRLLTAANKWLLAHEEASEAKNGAWVGLTGENIDIAGEL